MYSPAKEPRTAISVETGSMRPKDWVSWFATTAGMVSGEISSTMPATRIDMTIVTATRAAMA